jgi:hypothetical protein
MERSAISTHGKKTKGRERKSCQEFFARCILSAAHQRINEEERQHERPLHPKIKNMKKSTAFVA